MSQAGMSQAGMSQAGNLLKVLEAVLFPGGSSSTREWEYTGSKKIDASQLTGGKFYGVTSASPKESEIGDRFKMIEFVGPDVSTPKDVLGAKTSSEFFKLMNVKNFSIAEDVAKKHGSVIRIYTKMDGTEEFSFTLKNGNWIDGRGKVQFWKLMRIK